MMRDNNDRTRIEFTIQELEAVHTLVRNELRVNWGTTKVMTETLGGILMKVGRANNRIKTQEKDK